VGIEKGCFLVVEALDIELADHLADALVI